MPEVAVSPAIRHECNVLARYLTGRDPSEPAVLAWARGLESATFLDAPPVTAFDRRLLEYAARSPAAAGRADAYGRFVSPAGPLRRRLVLLMAVLESTSPDSEAFESPGPGRTAAVLGVAAAGLGFVFRLATAIARLGPLHLATRWRSRRDPGRSARDFSGPS